MSKDKYPSIFPHQMEAIVFIILQIFFATRAVLKIGEYLTIRPAARASENVLKSPYLLTAALEEAVKKCSCTSSLKF